MSDTCINASVLEIINLTSSVLQVTLQPERYIDYYAGQYLEIVIGSEVFAYSLANSPCGQKVYILHMRHRTDNPIPDLVLQALDQTTIKIRVPIGDCHLNVLDPLLPLVCIAGGSGITPIKAMLDQLAQARDTRQIHLFWGARFQEDFYLQASIDQWALQLDDFNSLLQLSELDQAPLIYAVLEQAPDLKRAQIVLSGPFAMVYHARDVLINAGVLAKHLFADAFYFEKLGE